MNVLQQVFTKLTQARELYAKGYHLAAILVARAAVEGYVRHLFSEHTAEPRNSKKGRRAYGRVKRLQELGVIDGEMATALLRVVWTGNDAIHGGQVSAPTVHWAIKMVEERLTLAHRMPSLAVSRDDGLMM